MKGQKLSLSKRCVLTSVWSGIHHGLKHECFMWVDCTMRRLLLGRKRVFTVWIPNCSIMHPITCQFLTRTKRHLPNKIQVYSFLGFLNHEHKCHILYYKHPLTRCLRNWHRKPNTYIELSTWPIHLILLCNVPIHVSLQQLRCLMIPIDYDVLCHAYQQHPSNNV